MPTAPYSSNRASVWPGMEITTRVRLRGIDAPKLRARCDDEREKALAAREAGTYS